MLGWVNACPRKFPEDDLRYHSDEHPRERKEGVARLEFPRSRYVMYMVHAAKDSVEQQSSAGIVWVYSRNAGERAGRNDLCP